MYAKSTERGGFGVSRKDRVNVEKYYQFIDYFTDTEPGAWPIQIELFLHVYPSLAWSIREIDANYTIKVYSLNDETSINAKGSGNKIEVLLRNTTSVDNVKGDHFWKKVTVNIGNQEEMKQSRSQK